MSCPALSQFIKPLFGYLFNAFFAAVSKSLFGVDNKVYHAFSTSLRDFIFIC